VNSKWSAEEDLLLTESVQRFGDKNWQQVKLTQEEEE
jgi:hypothetical protein